MRGVLAFREISRAFALVLWSIWLIRLPAPLGSLEFWGSVAHAFRPIGDPRDVIGALGIAIGTTQIGASIVLGLRIERLKVGARRALRLGSICATTFWTTMTVGFAQAGGILAQGVIAYGTLAWLTLPTSLGLPGPRRS